MEAHRPVALTPWVSLPPHHPLALAERVAAPFAAPIVARLLKAAPPGALVAAAGAVVDPVSLPGRPWLVVDPDPLTLLALSVELFGPSPEEVSRAFTTLLDAPYRGRPWGHYLQSLYLTSCPACGRPAAASACHWQGAPPMLMTCTVQCDSCGFAGESAAADDDRTRAAEAEPGRTLVWETLDRVVPASDPLRPRVEQAAALYTPRSQWALWQTLRILRDLSLPQDQRRALQWVLAETLWCASSLAEQPDLVWQAAVRRPRRFVERSVWVVLHEALAFVQARTRRLDSSAAPAASVQLAQSRVAVHMQRHPPESLALALVQAPACLPLYWLLRFVWSGWLFGPQAAAMLADALALRPGDWETLQMQVGESVDALLPYLCPSGVLAVQWRWRGDAGPTAALLSALPSPVEVSIAAAGDGDWTAAAVWTCPPSSPAGVTPAAPAAGWTGADLLTDLLAARGEPVPSVWLHTHLLAAWRRRAAHTSYDDIDEAVQVLLDPQAPPPGVYVSGLGAGPWEPGEMPFWWLDSLPDPWQPASDRVECVVLDLLHAGSLVSTNEVAWHTTLQLPAVAAPDRQWIEALVASYAETTPTGLTLRGQDRREDRASELDALALDLLAAGRRLGFDATTWSDDGCHVVEWQQAGQRRAGFLLTSTSSVTRRIVRSRTPIPGYQRFLVMPGGRAGLVQWRIDHQPLWASAALAGGWTFTKFRQLRQLLTQTDLEPYRWLAHLGQDPITAARVEQLRLL